MKTCETCGKDFDDFYIACPKCDLGKPRSSREAEAVETTAELKRGHSYVVKYCLNIILLFATITSTLYFADEVKKVVPGTYREPLILLSCIVALIWGGALVVGGFNLIKYFLFNVEQPKARDK